MLLHFSKYMLFTGWEVHIGRRAEGGTQTEGTVSLNTNRPKPVNSIFIFFQLRFKSFRKIFLHSPTYVCWSRTRSCSWSTRSNARSNQTKHYNMIFRSVIHIIERFLCLARQFIIWASNKDKRIDELDIKSARKKIQQLKDFLGWIIQKLL